MTDDTRTLAFDLSSLRVFLAVGEGGSMTSAARHLGLTQPAVSQTVARLEKRFGAALVDRASNDSVRVHLVNTNPVEAVPVVLQAGAFGEHRFGEALFDANGLSQQVAVDGRHLRVDLGPAVSLVIELSLTRYAHRPSYGRPPQ